MCVYLYFTRARNAKLINNEAKKNTESIAPTKRGLEFDDNKTADNLRAITQIAKDKLAWKEEIHSQED